MNHEVEEHVAKIIANGRPVAPQVLMLMNAFKDRGEGETITYEEIDGVIHERRDPNRFRTVLEAFKKALLKERNLETSNLRTVGVRILMPRERTFASVHTFRSAGRKLRKATKQICSVPTERLAETDRQTHLHAQNRIVMADMHIRAELSAARVELGTPNQPPRMTPPASKALPAGEATAR